MNGAAFNKQNQPHSHGDVQDSEATYQLDRFGCHCDFNEKKKRVGKKILFVSDKNDFLKIKVKKFRSLHKQLQSSQIDIINWQPRTHGAISLEYFYHYFPSIIIPPLLSISVWMVDEWHLIDHLLPAHLHAFEKQPWRG